MQRSGLNLSSLPLSFRRELSFALLTPPFLSFTEPQAASIPDLLWTLLCAVCFDCMSTIRLFFPYLTNRMTTLRGLNREGRVELIWDQEPCLLSQWRL